MHGIVRRPVVSSLSLFLFFLFPSVFPSGRYASFTAGNPIFSDMVFGAQMMRAPSYRRRFVSLYLTGRQLHPGRGGRNPRRNWKVSFCSSARFIPLIPLRKVCNPPTLPYLYIHPRPFPSRCAARAAAPDLNTIGAFLRRENPRKPERVPAPIYPLGAPCDCTFTLKAPFKRIGVEEDYFQYRPDALNPPEELYLRKTPKNSIGNCYDCSRKSLPCIRSRLSGFKW